MRIKDLKKGHRAITFQSTEKLTSQYVVAALVSKGHSRAYATELVAHVFDALEEMPR